MTFLGACCREQQVKQTGRLTTYKRKQNILQALFFAIVFMFVMVLCTANAQYGNSLYSNAQQTNAQQSNVQQAKVRLELLTTSSSLVNSGSSLQLLIDSHVGLRVSSDSNTYIYIYNFDATGKIHSLSNPNDNFFRVGQTRTYPDNHSLYKVSGPAGRESIFAIASYQPLSEARLQQLQTQHVQTMLAQTNIRGLVNGGMNAGQAALQDGWLADSIVFNVVASNGASGLGNATTQPNTQLTNQPSQIPVSNNSNPSNSNHATTTSYPAANHTPNPVTTNVTAANLSGFNTSHNCGLAGLNLQAPKNSQGFKQRCINRTFDGSFGSPASLNDVVVHFGNELVNNGFSYQGMINSDQQNFRGTFMYQQKTFQMQVIKSGQFYRFELLEFNPQAMSY